ncbi:Serine/threonine-protein phosphatase 7 long form-like [Vitis vinifera]|uniref:Serine/threonine-protein phosphatase 7 long form-like n=1 Tax=Vitis vinifera TaxID=29760 RepID=A0A438IVU5_VITVI|nr:Serine/threonine-protein phosphatase 7 long form-like [Vitis vinifera]
MDEIELYIEQVPVQPQVRGQLLGNFTHLLLGENDNVEEFEYGCGPSSAPIAMTYEYRADEDEEKALHKAMEIEQGIYVSMDVEGCDMSNNLDLEDPIEFSPVQYHSGNTNIGNSGGEFMVGQVFNSKADLQYAAKLYSISAHQEYIVVLSTTKLLVLRYKKAKQSQYPWRLCYGCKRAALATKIEKFNKHMNTIERINAAAQQWLEAILLRNGHSLMIEVEGANQLASNEEYTPYVNAKVKANVVKAGSHEIVLYDHIQGRFRVKTNRGLRIHGFPIIGTCDIDWSLLCYELLGGNAILAHLYKELCRASFAGAIDIVECVTLLQILWEPYMGDLVAYLSAISLADQEIWWMMSPLICFDIVKWHQPKRVLRQFGLQQGIPPSSSIDQNLYSMDRRGRHKYDWGAFHAQYITLWASCAERIAIAPPMMGAIDQIRYHSIATTTQLLITGMVEIASRSVGPTSGALGDIYRIAIDILHVIGEEHRIHLVLQSPTSSYPSMRPPVSATTVRMQPI